VSADAGGDEDARDRLPWFLALAHVTKIESNHLA
jgi:hypothetical protein